MPYCLDPEVAAAFAAGFTALDTIAVARGDTIALRAMLSPEFDRLMGLAPSFPDVETRDFSVNAKDGAAIRLRWYSKPGHSTGSAVVYAHGGGMILGDIDSYDCVVQAYVSGSGVPVLSVDYRLAPEVRGDTPAEDVFSGLRWLVDNADALGVDRARIGIMGDSAGGGLAAGAAILARDRGVPVARQILIYPMLDDRTLTPDAALVPHVTWNYDFNFTGWNALLGSELGSDAVSPVAAPARLKNFSNLPPTYIEVGDLDIFRNEDMAFAQQLALAGVPLELHVHPGVPHGFERYAPEAAVTERIMADRLRVMRSL